MIYFAYGSNMSSSVMLDRCPGAAPMGPACVANHRLVFRLPSQRWGGFAADIVMDAQSSVWGVLWNVTSDHLDILDNYEARYDRYLVQPVNGAEPIEGLTYRVKPELASPVAGSPDPIYLAHLMDGAEAHGLPEEYVTSLHSFLVPST